MSPLGSSYYKEFIRAGHVAGARDQLDLSDAVAVMDDSYRVDRLTLRTDETEVTCTDTKGWTSIRVFTIKQWMISGNLWVWR